MTITGFPATHPSGAPYGTLFENNCREEISVSYAHAIATAARCTLENIRVDYQTVDATIRQSANHLLYDEASVDVQLKCTSADIIRDDHIAYPLEKKYYDSLRSTRRYGYKILVVLVTPERFEDWVTQSEDHLRLHKAAYWISLYGEPATLNAASKTIHIPRTNLFNVEQLLGILSRIGSGGAP